MTTLTVHASIREGLLIPKNPISLYDQDVIVTIKPLGPRKHKTEEFKKFQGMGKGKLGEISYTDLRDAAFRERYGT